MDELLPSKHERRRRSVQARNAISLLGQILRRNWGRERRPVPNQQGCVLMETNRGKILTVVRKSNAPNSEFVRGGEGLNKRKGIGIVDGDGGVMAARSNGQVFSVVRKRKTAHQFVLDEEVLLFGGIIEDHNNRGGSISHNISLCRVGHVSIMFCGVAFDMTKLKLFGSHFLSPASPGSGIPTSPPHLNKHKNTNKNTNTKTNTNTNTTGKERRQRTKFKK